MKISYEIHQLIFKRLIFLNSANYKKYFDIVNGALVPKNQLPKKLEISLYVIFKKILVSFLMLILYLTQIMRIYDYRKDRLTLIYSLTSDQIIRNNKIEELSLFLAQNRFDLQSSTKILVESKNLIFNRKYDKLNITFDISLRLFIDYTNIWEKIKILKNIVLKYVFLISNWNKYRYLFLASKEFVFDETIIEIIGPKIKINKVITTVSNLNYQPFIFETNIMKGKRFMLWYSANSIPFRYKDSRAKVFVSDTDIYKYMNIDFHWVWTSDHKAYLSKLCGSQIDVKGSMVFYPSKEDSDKNLNDIVIFDVTPTTGMFSFNSIYNFDLSYKFIMDIVELSQKVTLLTANSIKISVKPKRITSKTHDIRYVKLLKNLQNKNQIKILDHSYDIYNLISSSKLIISYPFTSPAIIGKELDIPSIYYLPKNLLISGKNVHGVTFFQNKGDLQKYIFKLFSP